MMEEVEHGVIIRPGEHIRIVTRAEFDHVDDTPRGGPRRMHLFRVPDSRPRLGLFPDPAAPDEPSTREIQCGGKLYCRECIRESAR